MVRLAMYLPRLEAMWNVSSPVIEIADNSSLHLDLQVFEKDLPKIKSGQIIHFNMTHKSYNRI